MFCLCVNIGQSYKYYTFIHSFKKAIFSYYLRDSMLDTGGTNKLTALKKLKI